MGDPASPKTVCDPQLRVKGVSKLRVIDASVLPILTSGNTNAPVIMVGERGADIVKAAYGDKYAEAALKVEFDPAAQKQPAGSSEKHKAKL